MMDILLLIISVVIKSMYFVSLVTILGMGLFALLKGLRLLILTALEKGK